MSLNLAKYFSSAFCSNIFYGIALFSAVLGFLFSLPSQAAAIAVNEHLEDKLYRQALYFYFTGDYDGALRQVSLNRHRFNADSSRSDLFEAGLQVSVGLHTQATQTLSKIERDKSEKFKSEQSKYSVKEMDLITKNSGSGTSNTSPEELLHIALLQLAEQQIQQGESKAAQQTLSQITQVSSSYYEQFYILNQLAYWPEVPAQSVKLNDKNTVTKQSSTSAYIALNKALLHIEHGEFEQAESLLTTIKNKAWQAPSQTFWQLLFNPSSENTESDTDASINDEKRQEQAVNDYAQLLLAQLYVKQSRYESAYYELKNFPQDSPYTESALFIFAFSAHKIKHYTTSLKLLDLMQTRYPHSNLGWQSALLLAEQVIDQKTLEEGMASFQNAEQLYQQKLTDLSHFYRAFSTSNNVLIFSAIKDDTIVATADSSLSLFTDKSYVTNSVWLQKALLDVELQADYQALIELDILHVNLQAQQKKSQWLQNTLLLNKKRKAKVITQQQKTDYPSIIAELNDKKNNIEKLVAKAETEQQGQAFANQTEAKWLQRIKASKQGITLIKDHRNIEDYQERLTRIENVLAWQLSTEFPDRLWQHKKQLKVINQQLRAVEQQRNRFSVLADSQQLLPNLTDRIQVSLIETSLLADKTIQLRAKISDKIKSKVKQFVDGQRRLLTQHLLTARHEMAAALEQMSATDKRIERQLTPSVNSPKIIDKESL